LLHAAQAERDGQGRFVTIPGDTPDLARMGAGCPFAARCTYTMAECRETMPAPLALPGDARQNVRCWRYETGAQQRTPREAGLPA
jgi:oligopeptide/dipeptide ABC transporter ATP-binding protein